MVDGSVTGADDAGSKVVVAGRADVDVEGGTVVAAVVLAAVVVVVDEHAANTAINPTPIASRDRVLIALLYACSTGLSLGLTNGW